jgi:hypothetical protein
MVAIRRLTLGISGRATEPSYHVDYRLAHSEETPPDSQPFKIQLCRSMTIFNRRFVFAVKSCNLHRRCGYQLKAKPSRSLLKMPDHSLAVLLFVRSRTSLYVFFTVFDQSVVKPSQLMGCRGHGFRAPKPRFHPSIIGSQLRIAGLGAYRSLAKGCRRSIAARLRL